MAQTAPAAPEKDSILPVIGGVMILLAGIAALAMGGMMMALDTQDLQDVWSGLEGVDLTLSELEDIAFACGAVAVVFGIIAVLGGLFAVMKKHFGLAVVGGIFAIVGLGFGVGSVLGLIGLILVAVGKSSFSK